MVFWLLPFLPIVALIDHINDHAKDYYTKVALRAKIPFSKPRLPSFKAGKFTGISAFRLNAREQIIERKLRKIYAQINAYDNFEGVNYSEKDLKRIREAIGALERERDLIRDAITKETAWQETLDPETFYVYPNGDNIQGAS